MKLKNIFYLLLATVALVATACNQNSNSETAQMSSEDSAKVAFYNRYFDQASLLPNDKNRPVDTAIAKRCVGLYVTTKTKMDVSAVKKMLKTESVSFQIAELKPWLDSTLRGVKFDNMRICLGVYDTDALRDGGRTEMSDAGRLTVYLWPYAGNKKAVKPKKNPTKDDEEEQVEPFNLGTLNP